MTQEIVLSNGMVTLVDDEDQEWLSRWTWRMNGNGYALRTAWNKARQKYCAMFMHRMILNAPAGVEGDHINGNKLDNRRANLRIATRQQNNCNRPKAKGTTSKYKGVQWEKSRGKWRVKIRVDRKRKHLGFFTNEVEAGHAYDAAARKYFGPFACTNFPIGTERCALVNAATADIGTVDGR